MISEKERKRFWKLVNKNGDDGCWIWEGHKNPDGYGNITVNNKKINAHRYSYMIEYGEIPQGHVICHKCDNPSCVNPNHLFAGTRSENSQDMKRKGRQNNPMGKDIAEKIRKENKPNSVLAMIFGVSARTIRNIKARRVYK